MAVVEPSAPITPAEVPPVPAFARRLSAESDAYLASATDDDDETPLGLLFCDDDVVELRAWLERAEAAAVAAFQRDATVDGNYFAAACDVACTGAPGECIFAEPLFRVAPSDEKARLMTSMRPSYRTACALRCSLRGTAAYMERMLAQKADGKAHTRDECLRAIMNVDGIDHTMKSMTDAVKKGRETLFC